jgi:hypothetical protein
VSRGTRQIAGHVDTLPTSDALFILRCNETVATSNLVDDLGVRTMIRSGSPPVVASLTGDSPTGARSFFAGVFATRAVGDTDHTGVFQQRQGWGFSCLVRDSAGGTIAEYGQASSGGLANNVQFACRLASGQVAVEWQSGNRLTTTGLAPLVIDGRPHQVGCSVYQDPDQLDRAQLDIFVDGTLRTRTRNLPWPDGGSQAQWAIGASYNAQATFGAVTDFFNGELDDVVVTRFAPDVAWHRSIWARAVRDFASRILSTTVGGRATANHLRVLVQAPAGRFPLLPRTDFDWVDLTNVVGVDFVRGATISDDKDSTMIQAKVELLPRYGEANLSPFVANDPGGLITNPFSDLAEPDAHLIQFNRRIRIESCTTPVGQYRQQSTIHFEPIFDGFIRSFSPTQDAVTLDCLDLGAIVAQTWIEPSKDGGDRKYGSPGGSPLLGELQKIVDENSPNRFETPQGNGGAYGIRRDAGTGQVVIQTLSHLNVVDVNGAGRPHLFDAGDKIRVTGTTNFNGDYTIASTAPVTSTTPQRIITAETVSSAIGSTIEYTAIVTGVPALAYLSLGVPRVFLRGAAAPPNVFEWLEPASKSVLSSIDDVTQALCAWRCRYQWDDAAMQFRLQLFDPAVQRSSPILVEDVLAITDISTEGERMRNVIVAEVSPTQANDSLTNTLVTAQDTAGIERLILSTPGVDLASGRRYGRAYARSRFASDSMINSLAENRLVVDRMISDLADPVVDLGFDCLFFESLEVGDVVTVLGDTAATNSPPTVFAGNRTGVVSEITHRLEVTGSTTQIKLLNVVEGNTLAKPLGSIQRHHDGFQQRGGLAGRGLSGPRQPFSVTADRITATDISVSWPMPSRDLSRIYRHTEIYASTVNGFTPAPANFRTIAVGTVGVLPNIGASTLYIRVRHVDENGNYSPFSAQLTKV